MLNQLIIMDNHIRLNNSNNKIDEESASFGEAIIRSLSKHPDFIGMIDAENGEKVTFGLMKERSIRCALWLRKLGVGDNDVVAVSTPLHMDDYVPYLATLYINAIFNPWPYDASQGIVHHFLDTCRPKVIFACRESIDRLSEMAKNRGINSKFIVFENYINYPTLDDIISKSTDDEVHKFKCTKPSDPQSKVSAIYLSSGTTGIPKAILLSYHCLASRYSEEYGLHTGMNCLWYTPLQLNLCRTFISSAILLRCTRILHRNFEVEETSRIIEKYEVNFIYWTPYFLMLCYQAKVFKRYNFTNLETIAIAGAKANKALLEDCQKSLSHTFIKNSYGITEAGGLIAQQTEKRKNVDSVGFLCSGVELKVIDLDTGRILGPNQEGELHIKTDTVMLGYLDNPEQTKKTIDEDGWMHTGDLGFYDDNGEITITGRIKEIIRTKSLLLSSTDFEELLMQHPGVSECAVVAVNHLIDIERPFAFVVKAPNAKVTIEELVEFSGNKNERFRLTGGVAFVNELPYTASGKKCLRKLQEMAKAYI